MLYLILVSLVWGFSFIIVKGTLSTLDSHFVSLARMLFSLVVFVPFLRPAGMKARAQLQLMLIGSVQFGIMYLAYIASFRDLPAHVIALLTTTTPIFVAIFSNLYAGRIAVMPLLAALLAAAGGAVLQYPDQPPAVSIRGVALVQVSNAAFAFGQIAYTKWMASRPALHDRNVFGFLYLGGCLATGAFTLLAASRHGMTGMTPTPNQWLALIYLGVIASGLCFFLWNSGARKVEEGTLAVMNNMKIPVAVIASLVILRERTGWLQLATGSLLVVLALLINRWNKPGDTGSHPHRRDAEIAETADGRLFPDSRQSPQLAPPFSALSAPLRLSRRLFRLDLLERLGLPGGRIPEFSGDGADQEKRHQHRDGADHEDVPHTRGQ